jgi:hypothetical protein
VAAPRNPDRRRPCRPRKADSAKTPAGSGPVAGNPPPTIAPDARSTSSEGSDALVRRGERLLTAARFQQLAEVPPEVEWFANIDNPRTRRAYRTDLHDFMSFVDIATPEEFRTVTRPHIIAWRK